MPSKPKTKGSEKKISPRKDGVPSPAAAPEKEKPKRTYQLLRGMHDQLPKEELYWKRVYAAVTQLAEQFQFSRIETPALEEAALYLRSLGRGTDVVEKEMYVFEDRDGTRVALRPEGTAGVVRAYLTHGLWNAAPPTKVWYWESMFRHDRPQAGRYREHHQIGFETLGGKDPAIDAELLFVVYRLFQNVGLPVELHLNSIGTLAERQRYTTELANYYRSKRSYLCEDCRLRLTKNPLRLLDCKEPSCAPVREDAPQLVDWLESESKHHFMKILEHLDELSIPYTLAPYLVRGFDYYTGLVFEVYPLLPKPAEEGAAAPGTEFSAAQSALGGGGRYDGLVEELGGQPSPAAGFGLGAERIVLALKQYQQSLESVGEAFIRPPFQAFFAHLGEDAKRRALKLIAELNTNGLRVAYNFCKFSLKSQLEAANSLRVPYVLILGQKEVQEDTIIIRDMESGVQEIVGQKKFETALKKKLGLS